MKNLILIGLCGLLMGCEYTSPGDEAVNYRVINIEGCEYIKLWSRTHAGFNVVNLTHKGNCNNKIHLDNYLKLPKAPEEIRIEKE